MQIILKGSPQSNNMIYRSVCRGSFPQRYMNNKAKALKEDYQWQIKQQMRGMNMLTCQLRVAIQLYHKTKRKSDWDNFHKLSMDAMSGLVYEDDSQIQFATVSKGYDPVDPRIEIDIRPL